jgi:RHS repeat-associated protein
MAPNGSVYVPIADQVGTTWALLDESGDKVNSYGYDAFGVGRSASETVGNLYRFDTKRLDPDSALYHFIARQYVPRIGRFATRDPSRRAWELSVYAYVSGRPLSSLDPRGLWWVFLPSLGYPYQGSHDELTDIGTCGFSFGPETFKHLKSAGDIQDYPYLMGAHPEQHWDADSPSPADRWLCFARSWKYVTDSVSLAYYYADQCRGGKAYSLSYGQSGINTLGGALHTVQDFLPHHCITAAEHKLYDADNPARHPWAWWGSLAATCAFLLGYRILLLARGWTEDEIRCCVETPYDRAAVR